MVTMEIQSAVAAFSQSEKIKAGLLWTSQCLQVLSHLTDIDKRGAEKMIQVMIGLIAGEIQLARRILNDDSWADAARHVETASVMANSGVASDAGIHLTRALSHVTNIGQRAMTRLRQERLV
jgi:hypothetical protein